MPFSVLNETSFSNSLDEIINNAKYGQEAQKLSDLYRDRPQHPLDTAAFWIEYVIRHNGARHMQSPAIHLHIFQYYMLDVVAFIFVLFVIAIRITGMIYKQLIRKVFRLGVNKLKTT